MRKSLVLTFGLLALSAFLFTGCPQPTDDDGGKTVTNKTALASAISTAETALTAAEVNEAADPSAIPAGVTYISAADKTAYQSAIAAAKSVNDNASATQAQIDAAVSTFTAAIAGKIKTGTNTTVPDKTALASAISTAETALTAAEVNEAADPSAIPAGVTYISAADKTAYQAAITAAKSVNDNASATQAQIDAAVSTFTGAITGKIKTGTGGGNTTDNPAIPANVQAVALSGSSIQISWDAPSSGGTPTWYSLWRNGTDLGEVLPPSITTYTDGGLSAETEYYYVVFAHNDSGSASSQPVSATTLRSPAPGVPTNVTAVAQSSSSILISWNAPSSGEVMSYIIWRAGSVDGNYTQIGGSYELSYTDTKLSAGTTYYYKVSANGGYGESDRSPSVSATTNQGIPGTPTNVTATALSSTSIKITWDEVTGATSYNVYSPEEAGSSSNFVLLDTVPTNSYTDNGVKAGQTWYYKVSAVNSADEEGAQSVSVSAKTPSSGGSGGTTEYRIAQAIFSTCSKSGASLVFNWTLTTTGKTPTGFTYTSPSSIVVSVRTSEGSYRDLETLPGSARKYTLNNFESWATGTNADGRVYFRVTCVGDNNNTISYSAYSISANAFTFSY